MIIAVVIAAVLIIHTQANKFCNIEVELEKCTKPLYHFADPTLSSLNDNENITEICPDLESAVDCVENYSIRCNTSNEEEAYIKRRYAGLASLVQHICSDPHRSINRDVFLTHASCIKEMPEEIEYCVKDYSEALLVIETARSTKSDNLKEGDHRIVEHTCCSFLLYFDCVSQLVNETCGEIVVPFTKIFFQQLAPFLNKGLEYKVGYCDMRIPHSQGLPVGGIQEAISYCNETNTDRDFEIRTEFLRNVKLPDTYSYWIPPVITTPKSLEPTTPVYYDIQCEPEPLENCIEPLYHIADPSFLNVPKKKDLEKFCSDAEKSLFCLRNYPDHCKMNHKDESKKYAKTHSLILQSLIGSLCVSGQYQNEFFNYTPCIQKAIEENVTCIKRYTEKFIKQEALLKSKTKEELDKPTYKSSYGLRGEILRLNYCAFYEYVFYILPVIRSVCSSEAADVSNQYFEKIAFISTRSHRTFQDCTFSSTIAWQQCLFAYRYDYEEKMKEEREKLKNN